MTTPQDLIDHCEKLIRVKVIRDGKLKIIKKQDKPARKGYKLLASGKYIKMTQKEIINRSKAAKKTAKKASTKRNKLKSDKRRKSLIG